MKKIVMYMFLLAGFAITWSCREDDNMEPVGNWQLSEPLLSAPASGASLVLNEELPNTAVNFEWQPAVASNRFLVAYRVVLVPAESNDYADPVLELVPGNNGKDLAVAATAEQIDHALWAKCYPANAVANLKWVVIAKAIEKEAVASAPVQIKRFATERTPSTLYISGEGTEAGANAANATIMRARKNAENQQTGIFDVYISLNEGKTYHFRDQANARSKIFGGANGTLAGCGAAIVVPESGVYRVTVNLNDNTYALWKVERWSLVGDAVQGGWGGDVPLAYKGNGVWESKIEFLSPNAGWIFRANGNWGYIIKRVKGTVSPGGLSGKVFMESEAGAAGVQVEDLRIEESGIHAVTLDLRADAYTFAIVPEPVDPSANQAVIGKSNNPTADAVSGNFVFGTYDASAELYLVSNGQMVEQFTKDGMTFTSKYLALEKNKQYIINSKNDGSGTTYNNVGDGKIAVDHDQAYTLTVNFETGKLQWKHYNMKLFHWNEAGGWDQRKEYVMTYVHPYKFEVAGVALTAGHDSKFNSPWDVQFGTASTALTGTMTNGGPNYKGITQSGSYNASIVVSDDFSAAEYTFVKQ
jgi:starch-binding outer membrane protein SusE/F